MVFLEGISKNSTYKELIKYACNNCDVISFKVIIHYPHEEITIKQFNEICNIFNLTEEYIINNYENKKFLDELYLKLKNMQDIKESIELKKLKKEVKNEQILKDTIRDIIFVGIGKTIYKKNIETLKKDLKDLFIKKETIENKSMYMIEYEQYFYKITQEIQEKLLKRNNLYDWIFPYYPEDLAFYKNEQYWMQTISHEKWCMVYPRDKEEMKYLNNIGIKIKQENIKKHIYKYIETGRFIIYMDKNYDIYDNNIRIGTNVYQYYIDIEKENIYLKEEKGYSKVKYKTREIEKNKELCKFNKETQEIFMNTNFKIYHGNFRYYLVDLEKNIEIEKSINEYFDDEISSVIYLVGENGYIVLDYGKELLKEYKKIEEMEKEVQNIFYNKKFVKIANKNISLTNR